MPAVLESRTFNGANTGGANCTTRDVDRLIAVLGANAENLAEQD